MRDLKFHLLRLLFALIMICSLSITITYVLYWISKSLFRIDFGNTWGVGLVLFFGGIIIWVVTSTSTTQEKGGKKLQNWFDSKLGRFELRTRYALRLFILRIGTIIFLGTFLYGFFGSLAGKEHMFFVDVFLVGLFLIWFSFLFISDTDVALVFFRKFRDDEVKNDGDLRRALKRYNKSVNFRFSTKKLSAIAQYVMHAYDLNLEECKNNVDMRLNEIVQSLENKQYGQVPEILVKLSTDCDSFMTEYSGLGIKIKPSLWIRAKEAVSSSLLKILPQLFWLLILIAVYLVLRTFIPIEISLP